MRPHALAAAALALVACAPSRHVHARAAEEVRRGYAYLKGGDAERAEVAFEHALAFNGDFPEALNGLGIVERRRGRLEAARGRFERAIRVDPDFAEARSNLGACFLALGRGARAREELEAALRIDPDLAVARLNLARALLHEGREAPERREAAWARARVEYLHLLESQPDLFEAHHDLGFMDYERGAYARAELEYGRAAALDPRSVEALHGRCIAHVRLGRCAEAARSCRACLEVSPVPQCRESLRGALACE